MQNTQKPIVPLTTTFSVLQCQVAFNSLTPKEKAYAYYFSRASWQGSKICYFERSYESPALLYLILRAFSQQQPEVLFNNLKNQLGQQTLKKIYIYFACFLGNCGNYKSFGDSKFVPDVTQDELRRFFLSSTYWKNNEELFNEIYEDIKQAIFKYDQQFALLNFYDLNGTSGYYSKNVTQQNAECIKQILNKKKILSENNRLIKINENEYIVRIASQIIKKQQFQQDGIKIRLQYGQFSPFLKTLNSHLQNAKKYAQNQIQQKMISSYIEHFREGDVNKHKQSQVYWVQDKGPVIQTNIGFIQSYLDPLKVRAQFQGFVAVVNKEESKLLTKLVENAEQIIKDLPWGKNFELDKFNKPDFTSLEVLTFASSGIPVGINIPNYDQIRKNHGFKNVNLGNAYGKPTKQGIQYVPQQLLDLHVKYYTPSLFLIVALHELLGHGTGKLYYNVPEQIQNPLGYKFQTCYKQHDTWHSVFGDIASGYEECRADAVALYLSTFSNVRQILLPNYSEQEQLQIVYIAWYDIVLGAIRGLQFYDPLGDRWTQAHIAASYAIFQVLVEQGGIVQIRNIEKDGKPNLEIILNKQAIHTKGKNAIGKFLQHLQIYKSTGDLCRGKQFFERYLKVDETLSQYRQIVIKNKKPRKIDVQPDVEQTNGQITYRKFGGNVYEAIQSHVYHYRDSKEQILSQWRLNRPFKY